MRIRQPLFVLAFVGLLILGGILLLRSYHVPRIVATTAPAPTTSPAAPTTAAAPAPLNDYMDVVLARYPGLPTTRPLVQPLSLDEAAHLILTDPIYCDSIGELWITDANAPSTARALDRANERSTHTLRETVVFVHRQPDEAGNWFPQLICKRDDGSFEWITHGGRRPIGGAWHYDWSAAYSWNNALVVPTDHGISVIQLSPLRELHHEFEPVDAQNHAAVQTVLDWRGLLAWQPCDDVAAAPHAAARFVDDAWLTLDSTKGWPQQIIQLVPLLDGSVLQVYLDADRTAKIGIASLDAGTVDEAKIAALIAQLSDPSAPQRAAAYSELTRWGPKAWPILEKAAPDQPAEAQVRLQQILESRDNPALFGLRFLPGPVKALARANPGTAMLYAEAGVSFERDGDTEPITVTPAWISVLPQSVALASSMLTDTLKKPGTTLANVRGEWIVSDEAQGPAWWLANHLTPPLLRPREMAYRNVSAFDSRGRWLFRKSPADLSPTLILDPTLPDLTPRLPVWVYKVPGGKVGWTSQNWPALKSGGAWTLINNDWKPVNESIEKLLFADAVPASPAAQNPATSAPATAASATTPSTKSAEESVLLTDTDGAKILGGNDHLRVVHPDGTTIDWPMPARATGTDPPQLFRAGDDRLFLYNAPGRLIRLRRPSPTAASASEAPFTVEAVFTHNIPTNIQRLWLDPAGRFVFVSDTDTISIAFPSGRIPPEFASKMTAADLTAAEATDDPATQE